MNSLSNGVLMGKIYGFKLLNDEDRTSLLSEVIRRYQQGNNICGSNYRSQHIITICKELKGDPLTTEEQLLRESVHAHFEHIENIEILNICLLYWLITRNLKYQLQLQNVTRNPHSPVREAAKLIAVTYQDLN